MKVLLLDSGVDLSHPLLSNLNNIETGELKYNSDGIVEFVPCSTDDVGHGTAIAYILAKKMPYAIITSYKIFSGHAISEKFLIDVLEYILKDTKYDLINLSCGIINAFDIDKIQDVCNQLVAKGTIIVSAFDNNGKITYPAALNNVIGVDISPYCVKPEEYTFIENSVVNIRGMSSYQRLPWKNKSMQPVCGSSFIVPHICAVIGRALQKGYCGYMQVLKYLASNAKLTYSNEILSSYFWGDKIGQIKEAIVFPYNKEMYNLLSFGHLLNFKIVGVYSYKGVCQKSIELEDGFIWKIKDFENIDWDSSFDTLILGHLNVASQILGSDLLDRILQISQMHGKKVYVFDSLSQEQLTRYSDNLIFTPNQLQFPSAQYDFGKMYSIPVPVLGIVGTSSKQGKFNLQLKLRTYFIKSGYRLGQLGSEPSSLLFGMDEIYPYGYASNLKHSPVDCIASINYCMQSIYRNKNPDIILFGTQSNTIHRSEGNVLFYPIYQYEILCGASPDVLILCVNYDDPEEYIQRTITYLSVISHAKLIALVLFPFHKNYSWNETLKIQKYTINEIETRCADLATRFSLPVFDLTSENSIYTLYKKILNFFAEGN